MALPNNIKQVKLPNNCVYEIIPERLKNGTYQASLPTLTADVTLATTANLSNYVPYSGATSNVDLGSRNFSASTIIATNYLSAPDLSVTSAIIWNYMQVDDDGNDSQDAPRPSNIIGYQDPDVYIYGTGVTIYDAETGHYTQLAYPSSSGTFATEEWVSSQQVVVPLRVLL